MKTYQFGFSCRVIEEDDSTWSVGTPISMERGFLTEEDARNYASSYGLKDSRNGQSRVS